MKYSNPQSHPRLLVPRREGDSYATSFQHVVDLVAESPRAAGWVERYRADADDLVANHAPVCAGVTADEVTLPMARHVMRRVYSLALMHHLDWHGVAVEDRPADGAAPYRDRAWAELAAAAKLSHWNPRHWLTTGAFVHGFAIGFDWLYDEWTSERRTVMTTALNEFGFKPYLAGIAAGDHWAVRHTGWNIVCNTNTVMAALAVQSDEPDTAEVVLRAAPSSLANGVVIYHHGPGGGTPGSFRSGAMYWRSSTGYIGPATAALEAAAPESEAAQAILDLINDDAVSVGLQHAALFGLHATGPFEVNFNYSDGADWPVRHPTLFWLGKRFPSIPELPDGRLGRVAQWLGARSADFNDLTWMQLPISLFWYEPGTELDPAAAGVSRDVYFPGAPPDIEPDDTPMANAARAAVFGSTEMFLTRSAWQDPAAVYLGAKGGFNGNEHSDLDAGTFVLDALNQRWITDFGSDTYGIDGYFDVGQFGKRWRSYRKRAEGHNVIVVNPGQRSDLLGEADMNYFGYGVVERHWFGNRETWCITDLTSTHPDLTQWRRGWKLFDDRRQVLVQDEVTCAPGAELWHFLHTGAERVEVAAGGRSATLHGTDAQLVVRLLEPADAQFELRPAEPLPTSPRPPDGVMDNSATQKLAVHLTGVAETRIVCQFSPLNLGDELPSVVTVEALDEWREQEAPTPSGLLALRLDGDPIPAVAATTYTYHVAPDADLESLAVEVATDHQFEIISCGQGRAVRVEDRDGAVATYRIYRRSPHWVSADRATG